MSARKLLDELRNKDFSDRTNLENENYWSLFKRALRGTYVNCQDAHLARYLDEETFRFNNRGTNDSSRFALVLGSVAGKRLTYAKLTETEKFKQLRLWKRLS